MAEKADKPEKPEKGSKPEGEAPEKGKPAKGKEGKEPKEPKEGKEKDKPVRTGPKRDHSDNPNFKFKLRMANTDLDGEQTVEIALAAVKGIGLRTAGVVADMSGVNRTEQIGNLDDGQIQQLEQLVVNLNQKLPVWMLNRSRDYETGEHLHIVATDVDLKIRDDLNRLKKIRAYRGVRHEQGQKVRGQRTRSNGRTGLTVGVQRSRIQGAAAAEKKEEGAAAKKEEKKEPAGAKPAAPAKPAAGGAKPEAKK